MRGAPHYHALLWIRGAPVIGKSDPKEVLAWIQERITCKIPDASLNPELHTLVTKYQMHKCTNYCKRRQKLKSGFITKCRFSFPRDVTEHAVLNPVPTASSSRATATSSSSRAAPAATSRSSRAAPAATSTSPTTGTYTSAPTTSRAAPAATSTSPTTGTYTSAPTTTSPAAPLAAATTTHMHAPMATTRPPEKTRRCGGGEERSNWTSCIARAFPSSAVTAKRSTISIRFMQRAALQAKLAQGFDHNHDSLQNTGLSRYAYSHWGILIAFLAPSAVLSVPIIAVLLCCKSQSHPNNICAAIDEGPTSMQSERIGMDFILIIDLSMLSTLASCTLGNWAPLKAVPATSSGSKPGCINLGKDTPLRGNISSNREGDPPACGVPGASGGESPKVYELPISAGANAHSPLLYEAPVLLPAEPDPLMYKVPASEGAEPMCVKSNERTQPTVLPDDETIQVAGARENTFPPLNLLSMETSALNRISCTQEACASSEMELICQLAKEEVMLISATDIQLLSEIGRGLLGSVHRALWHVPHKKPQEVTMIGLGTQKDRITLLQTAVTMGRLEHPNVVTTIGIMVEPERVCIVTEYCTNGSLLSYLYALRKRDGIRSVSGIQQLQTFARHIARGMIYLSDKGVIHHGLAAKNVYVSANDTCKVVTLDHLQFGMSPSQHISREMEGNPSFAVVYELLPPPNQVIGMLSVGHCLPPPPGCSRKIYKLMITAWHPTPSSRPTFRDILAQLEAKDEQTSPLSPEFPDLQSVGEGDNAKVYDLLYRDLHFLYLQQLDDNDYSECEESATPFIGYPVD
ncbi:hypothetical protein EMCRGX_G019298 [Ephydatia muelleri]